jgi:ABC-type nitrate/sulfonate/bicarbonate transport system ATPase subunit
LTPASVSVRALSHRFGDLEVLHDVNLEVADGEFIAIVGPSGCGKSTVLRALAGLVVPTSGRIEIGGADVVGRPGSTAFLPQRDLLLPWRRALANATVGAEVGGIDRGEAESRAHDLFDRFGLRGFEEAWPHELSGGMRQRVAVLRTFLLPRPVLLLDEPFGALDALTRRSMQRWLEDVWEDDGRSTILVTHDIEEALLLADRVLVMSERPGRIVDEVQVGFPRPRELEITTDDDFVGLNKRVLSRLFADEK